MEILHFKKSIALVCLLLAGFCSSEEFEIFRYIQPSNDFFISLSKCNKNNDTFDYCGEYNAAPVKGRECFCDCDERKATFSFYKQSWSCLKNEDVRTFFGCSKPIFFEREKRSDKLSVLKDGSEKEIPLKYGSCKIKASSSWYIDCQGKKVPLSGALTRTFSIKVEQESHGNSSELQVADNLPTENPLIGRIVNLGISCSSSSENHCLLFKLRGITNCPLTTPTTATKVNETVVAGLSTIPSQVLTPAGPAADRKNDDVSPVSLALILGVTAFIILIFLIAGVFIHRQHNARKHPRTISEGQNSQSDSGSQQAAENDGYATLSTYRASIYASNYEVPNGGSEDETGHLRPPCARPPRAAINSERHDNNGLDEEEPFYNTVDELFPNHNGGHEEYVDPATSERPRDYGPMSVEQRVYNMIEVLNTDTSESTYDYGSNEGHQEHVPISVEQPVYNIIEVLDEEPNESDPRNKAFSEEPLPNSTEDVEIDETSVKDPFYNVLEGPDPNKTDQPSSETLHTAKETRDQANHSSRFLHAVL